MFKKSLLCLFFSLSLMGLAQAHDFWLKPEGSRAVLYYGHGNEDSPYKATCVKKSSGLSASGQAVAVRLTTEGNHCAFSWESGAVEIAAEIDTGYWIKTMQGWKNQSKRNAGSYLLSEWSLYYTKLLLKPGASLNRALGHQLEIVPLQISDKSLKVRVLLHGKPLAETKIYAGHDKVGDTDAAGEATVPKNGLLVLTVSNREPLPDNQDADRLKLNAVLTVP